MRKLTLATLGLATLVAAPAIAADLPRRPVYVPPPPVYVFSWTGCYIGVHGGGVWVQKEFETQDFAGFGGSFSRDASGAVLGGQIGCNYQFAGGFVVGIQGDYAWTNVHAEGTGAFFTNLAHDYHVQSVGSVTGRIGYAWDRLLFYVKGGAAWERDELTFTHLPTGLTASFSDTRSGWTIGVGGEFAFTNWLTGFIEYNYYDFGNVSHTVGCGPVACFAGGPNSVGFDVSETKSVFKVGLNVLFGGGGGPVFAKY